MLRSGMARTAWTAAVVALLTLATALSTVSTAHGATPWGACGRSTAESKEVTKYFVNARTYYYLRCGNAGYGYRHILDRHRTDFERLAAGTYQNWRDVADLAMDSISRDPDAAKPAGNGKACLSRVIFLRNLRTNQAVRQQIIRMFVRLSDNAIITTYPHSSQCP